MYESSPPCLTSEASIFPALGLLDGSQSRFPLYTTVRLYVFSRFALILMFGISLGQMVSPVASTADEPTPEADDAVYEAGTNVVVIESDVNMRDAPSTRRNRRNPGWDTALVVTGGPEEADGYSVSGRGPGDGPRRFAVPELPATGGVTGRMIRELDGHELGTGLLILIVLILAAAYYWLAGLALRDLLRRPAVRGDNKVAWDWQLCASPFVGALLYGYMGAVSFLPRTPTSVSTLAGTARSIADRRPAGKEKR